MHIHTGINRDFKRDSDSGSQAPLSQEQFYVATTLAKVLMAQSAHKGFDSEHTEVCTKTPINSNSL